MGVRSLYFTVAATLGVLLLVSCVTGPVNTVTAPEWVKNPPLERNGEYYYFGRGFDPAGDIEQARREASDQILAGVRGSLQDGSAGKPDEAAEAILSELETRLQRSLYGEDDNYPKGFRLIGTHQADAPDEGIEYYMLVACNAVYRDRLQHRLSVLRESSENLVRRLERQGDSLAESGYPFQAVKTYLAAVDSAGSEAGDDLLSGLLEKAVAEVETIMIQPLSVGIRGVRGKPFPADFKARVVGSRAGTGIQGVALLATYSRKDEKGDLQPVSVRIVSGADGLVSFAPPPPNFSGTDSLVISLDLQQEFTALAGLNSPLLDDLHEAAARSRGIFPYRVLAPEKKIPTGLLIIDRDSTGTATDRGYTAAGILSAINPDQFDITLLDQSEEFLAGTPQDIARRTAAEYGAGFSRLIYGSARISAYSEQGDRVSVTILGSLTVVDVVSGRILYSSGEVRKSVIGNNPQGAVASAYRQLGKVLGGRLVTDFL